MHKQSVVLEIPVSNVTGKQVDMIANGARVSPTDAAAFLLFRGFSNLARKGKLLSIATSDLVHENFSFA